MLFVCQPKILHKHCFQFLLGVKMAPRETEDNAYQNFGVTNKEHYGMLWYFWSDEMANLFDFMFLLVDFGEVLCSPANELQQGSNASSREEYIPRILTLCYRFIAFTFDLCGLFCHS